MKKENTQEQETPSETEVMTMTHEDWRTLKAKDDEQRILNFREELKELQVKYMIEIIPTVTISGTEIINPVLRFKIIEQK